MKQFLKPLAALSLLAISPTLLAHSGHAETGLLAGLVHPFSGLDHLVAALAAGFWLALKGDSARSAVGLFALLLVAGMMLGSLGVLTPWMEPLLASSLLSMAALLVFRGRIPGWAGNGLIGIFALLHGLTHGAEAGLTGLAMADYGLGILLASLALAACGYAAGRHSKARDLVPVAGGSLALAGMFGLAG